MWRILTERKKIKFLVSLPYRCYISNLVKIGPVVLEKKMLTHDNWRQPIAIGHLSDSGDLQIFNNKMNNIFVRISASICDNCCISKLVVTVIFIWQLSKFELALVFFFYWDPNLLFFLNSRNERLGYCSWYIRRKGRKLKKKSKRMMKRLQNKYEKTTYSIRIVDRMLLVDLKRRENIL